MNATLNRQNTGSVSQNIVDEIESITPGSTELEREGKVRGLNTDILTMRARDLCPDQARTAASGFRQRIFGR